MVGSTRSKSRRRKVSRVKDATSPIIIHSDSTTSTATNTSKNSNNPNLRILSVNACCLPSGLRNAYLPSDTVRAGFSLHFLFYGIAIGLYQHYYSSTDIQSQFSDSQFLMKIALPLFLFCFLIGWVLGGQAARLIGKVRQQFFGWGSDYKFERLKFLSEEVFPSYDVIAVQELFSSYPNVLDAGHVDCLIGYAKKQGFIHVGRPGRAKFPSFAMNTGLLILSRYPIHESHVLVFSHQFIGEQFAVNRGAMYAKIVRPGYSPLHFFTAHVSPSMRKLLQGYPERLLKMGDEARTSQFQQLGTFITSKWKNKGEDRCIVAGDFNADIKYPDSSVFNSIIQPVPGDAMSVVLETLVDEIGLYDTANGKYVPTFGYMGEEHLLTNYKERETYKTDDLIFCDGITYRNRRKSWTTVSMNVNEIKSKFTEKKKNISQHGVSLEPNTPFTHASDHWGVEFIIPWDSFKSKNGEVGVEDTATSNCRMKTRNEKAWVLSIILTFSDVDSANEFITYWAEMSNYCFKQEPYLYHYEISQSDQEPLRYMVYERYASKKDYLNKHRNSLAFSKFRPKMKALQDAGRVTVSGHSYDELGIGFV
jgi:endonuclease/exonuclease/phosphatase family metal-dependent hydrolase/quinol monooxygenase YgiN